MRAVEIRPPPPPIRCRPQTHSGVIEEIGDCFSGARTVRPERRGRSWRRRPGYCRPGIVKTPEARGRLHGAAPAASQRKSASDGGGEDREHQQGEAGSGHEEVEGQLRRSGAAALFATWLGILRAARSGVGEKLMGKSRAEHRSFGGLNPPETVDCETSTASRRNASSRPLTQNGGARAPRG